MLPDTLFLSKKHLRVYTPLQALIEQRVYNKIPGGDQAVFPLIRMRRIGGVPDIPYWLDEARLILHAFDLPIEQGGSEYRATLVARTAHEGLHLAPEASLEDGVITDVEDVAGFFPDTDPETGRLFTRFEVLVKAHPHPAALI